MTTARKPLPTAARIAVRDASQAAQTAASYLRQVRRAQTAQAPGDRDLADALTELERIVRLLSEAQTGGGSMEEKGRPVPSINRAVHYRSYGTPGGEYASLCRAADITEVDTPGDPESAVGLCIKNPTGLFFTQHVPYGDAPGHWHWAEYVPPAKEDRREVVMKTSH